MLNRRELLAVTIACTGSCTSRMGEHAVPVPDGVPRVDYHAHLGDGISLDQVLEAGRARDIKFGVLQHAGRKGLGYAISDDGELHAWLRVLHGKPVFKGIEGEGLDWPSAFSSAALAKLDYAQSDPLGMPGKTGAPVQLWRPDFKCDDPQEFMELYTNHHVQLISTLPINILAVPTFLPDALLSNYEQLWTRERMKRVIDAAVKFNVAFEIDSRFRVPHLSFLEMAKAAGAKFSFGSNYQTLNELGDITYGIEMYNRLGLTLDRFFHPAQGS